MFMMEYIILEIEKGKWKSPPKNTFTLSNKSKS